VAGFLFHELYDLRSVWTDNWFYCQNISNL